MTKWQGIKVSEIKAAPFGSIRCVQNLPLGLPGPPPLPASLAVFTFFDDVVILFSCFIVIATWAIAGAIYRIAVGAQDCISKPQDGVLSLKYAHPAQWIS